MSGPLVWWEDGDGSELGPDLYVRTVKDRNAVIVADESHEMGVLVVPIGCKCAISMPMVGGKGGALGRTVRRYKFHERRFCS